MESGNIKEIMRTWWLSNNLGVHEMRLIKFITVFIFFSVFSASFAECAPPVFTKIQLQLNAEQWVSTKTAKVVVDVSAALEATGLSGLQQKVLQDLNGIYTTDWHITRFAQTQDTTGLLRANLQAEARMPEDQLPGSHDKVKAISKPGTTFTITDIDYSPSFAELTLAKELLRQQLYQQAQAELAVINKLYAPRQYLLYELTMFMAPIVMMNPAANTMMMARMVTQTDTSPSMEVSQRLDASATVTFAALLEPVAP